MDLVFVGTQAGIMDTPYHFDRFGQRVQMTPELAHSVAHDVPLIPADAFDAVGFTAAELAAHGDPETWRFAPLDFLAKQQAAWSALHEYRDSLTQ